MRNGENQSNSTGLKDLKPKRQQETMWKQGESGNPKGKPKGALRKKTILEGMMKYNMILNPTLLRRSEAVLERVIEKAESGDERSEGLILQYVLSPFLKMQALKSSGIKGEGKPVVNINISKADGIDMNKVIDA